MSIIKCASGLFQFQTGAIKRRHVCAGDIQANLMFQFQTGAIKSKTGDKNAMWANTRFNSKLVRLKAQGDSGR